MTSPAATDDELVRTWTLPSAARLGSSLRSKGIYLEIRSRLPVALRKSLAVRAGELTLRMPKGAAHEFSAASATISTALKNVESLPVLPREAEDILGISATERHRWLKDGRLPSAGTRTVSLRGRARKITFHVFDPRMVQELLERDVIDAWRELDAERAAENRRQAAWTAKLRRSQQNAAADLAPVQAEDQDDRFKLRGWAEFERNGPLR
jgi:hypothetical protein